MLRTGAIPVTNTARSPVAASTAVTTLPSAVNSTGHAPHPPRLLASAPVVLVLVTGERGAVVPFQRYCCLDTRRTVWATPLARLYRTACSNLCLGGGRGGLGGMTKTMVVTAAIPTATNDDDFYDDGHDRKRENPCHTTCLCGILCALLAHGK